MAPCVLYTVHTLYLWLSGMNKQISAKVGTALVVSHDRFLSLCSCPPFSHGLEVGWAHSDKDVTYFCEPKRVREHLSPNVMTVGGLLLPWLIKSDQTTPTQSVKFDCCLFSH